MGQINIAKAVRMVVCRAGADLQWERDDEGADGQEPGPSLEHVLVVDDQNHDDADCQECRLAHCVW